MPLAQVSSTMPVAVTLPTATGIAATKDVRAQEEKKMAERQGKTYDLTFFDAHKNGAQKHRATAASYSFLPLSENRARSAQFGGAIGDLLQSAMFFGGIDVLPFTIRDESLVVVACQGSDMVGISVIDPTGDTARDAVTWTQPTREDWVARALKVELLRNARAAGIDHVLVQSGTATEAVYEALGLHPVQAAA
ncbi:hypothetical protein [Streptomyces sp. NPDC092952]|uniref:hypothetical protein n=1 Tax=Streptomyces sp. NPDC092952 TaxID=3366018 RepID=UPI00380E5776